MREPRLAVLDIVTVRGGRPVEHGRRGVVTQIRRYSDGTYVYGLGAMSDGEHGGLYPDDWLEATGERSDLDVFRGSGIFKIRDVVRIGARAPEEIRGKLGEVLTEDEPDEPSDSSEPSYAVWVEDVQRVWMVSEGDLVPTGQRLSPPVPGSESSLRVSVSGDVLGQDTYEVLDHIDWHL